MDGARLASLVGRGYEIAGRKVGLIHSVYRPADPLAPLAPSALVGTAPATFDRTGTFPFSGSPGYGKAVWQAIIDPAAVQVGDYLAGAGRTWFVAALDHLQPPLVVECNATLSIRRPASPAGLGLVGYSGSTEATEALLLDGWPASVLAGGSGEATNPHLPGDARQSGWVILLPALPGVDIRFSDQPVAADGRRFLISAAERTRLGWRLLVRLAAS